MKTKKFLILYVLAIMVILLSGCNHNVTEKVTDAQKVANEFLTTKGYEIPRNYSINYIGRNKDSLCVTYKQSEIVFDILESIPEIKYIKDDTGVTVYRNQINEIKKVANEFLNTAGYQTPEGYEKIKYSGKDNKQLEVSKVYQKILEDDKDMKVTITFDILEDELEITDIKYYKNEQDEYAGIIVLSIWGEAIILILILQRIINIVQKR